MEEGGATRAAGKRGATESAEAGAEGSGGGVSVVAGGASEGEDAAIAEDMPMQFSSAMEATTGYPRGGEEEATKGFEEGVARDGGRAGEEVVEGQTGEVCSRKVLTERLRGMAARQAVKRKTMEGGAGEEGAAVAGGHGGNTQGGVTRRSRVGSNGGGSLGGTRKAMLERLWELGEEQKKKRRRTEGLAVEDAGQGGAREDANRGKRGGPRARLGVRR